jgi:hypothetical protein
MMELQLVQSEFIYEPAKLNEPSISGYIHIAAEVQPSHIPFLPASAEKTKFLEKLKGLVQQLEQHDRVMRADVYDAAAIPPFESFPNIQERKGAIRIPNFDVAVLVETKSPVDSKDLEHSAEYRDILDLLKDKAKQLHKMAAQNAKRVNDVDRSKGGTFMFNHFVADDREVMMKIWDYLAGWYEKEMGIDNSLLLVPTGGEQTDYMAVGHARLKGNAIGFVAKQMSKKSFKEYVQANLYANRVIAMPVLYKLID